MPPKETPSSSQKSKGSSSTKTLVKSRAIAIARKTPSKLATKRLYYDIDALLNDELS